MKTSFKVGMTLIAKDPCHIEGYGDCLTPNKKYVIVKVGDDFVSVIDDEGDNHRFKVIGDKFRGYLNPNGIRVIPFDVED